MSLALRNPAKFFIPYISRTFGLLFPYEKLATVRKHLSIDFDVGAELDFVLIGISCPLRDYRLCHFISKRTGIAFVRGKEDYTDHKGHAKEKGRDEMDFHIVFGKDGQKNPVKYRFPVYRYCEADFEAEYYLIGNRSIEGGLLLAELPHFDQFLMIRHYIAPDDLRALLHNIRSIPEVLLAKELDPQMLKSKENLIF